MDRCALSKPPSAHKPSDSARKQGARDDDLRPSPEQSYFVKQRIVLVGGCRCLASVLGNVMQQVDGCRVSGDLLVTSDTCSFSAHVLEFGFVEGSRKLKMVANRS